MDYSIYVDKILEYIGRGPSEVAIDKYDITYKDLISALINTNNMLDASIYLSIPKYSLQGYMRRKLINELPDKQSKKSWRVTLLNYIGYIQCPSCTNIFSPDIKNKFEVSKGGYYCLSCIRKRSKEYKNNNVEKVSEYFKQYYENNKPYFFAKAKAYKLSKESRVANWANLDKIEEIYNNCPEGYHVDHIIPLHGGLVSGLHVENNLQYLLAKDNLSKGNKFDLELAT